MTRCSTTAAEGLLEQAWSALGGDPQLLERVQVMGDATGLLPSRLAALPAMVASVAASTLGAALLDAARSRTAPGPVRVDREQVAVAARSERYARADRSPPAELFAPLSRFWRTSDGWLRLHTNYPWHSQRALDVLGVPEQPAAVAEAIGAWRGADLEDALAAAGALGYAVRTPEQWRGHPQGQAVAGLPLVQTSTTSGPSRPPGARSGAGARGVRVLDLTRVIAGPVATRTLAAWGADVLRLDSPDLPEVPALALDTLPGKRSAQLDLRPPAARVRLHELLAAADVLVQGYRPGALRRFGLDPDALAERHPHLTVVTLSAWGTAGPWAGRRGFDSLVQCPTGIASLEGDADAPGTLPAQILDHATGYLAAAAALISLAAAERGEPPRSASLSLAQTAHWLLTAGPRTREPPRQLEPDAYLVTLPGGAVPVQVVAPPGQAGLLRPTWSKTTDLGTDSPAFW